nr:hypothetical protein [Shewanella ferrihydritica]
LIEINHTKLIKLSSSQIDRSINMSDKCGNCDCADKSQCVKKGTSYGVVIVDAEKSHFEMAEEVGYEENDGKCKCTTGCSCAGCNCGK